MQYLDNYLLMFIGGGDVIDTLKQMAQELNISDKVRFIPKLPFDQLHAFCPRVRIDQSLDPLTVVKNKILQNE